MGAVFTTAGLGLFQAAHTGGTALVVTSIQVGTLQAAQRYDAEAARAALVDPSPLVLTPGAAWSLVGSGPRVEYQISVTTAPALVASEIGLFVGSTLVALIANAGEDLFTKAEDAQALFTFGFEISNGTPGAVTFTLNNTPIATQAQAEGGTENAVLMTPLRTEQYVDHRMATQAQAEAGTDDSPLMNPERTAEAIAALAPGRHFKLFSTVGTGAAWASGALGFEPREVEVEALIQQGVGSTGPFWSHGWAVKDDAGVVTQRCQYMRQDEERIQLTGRDAHDTSTRAIDGGSRVIAGVATVTATLGDDSVSLGAITSGVRCTIIIRG